METIIFCGIQATGKSSFYRQFFSGTHLSLSLDLLNTRNKLNRFMETCLQTQQRFVIDNTNLTKAERSGYIKLSKTAGFKVKGYYFQSKVDEAIERNNNRAGKAHVPEKGIRGSYKKLEIPDYSEGFDELFYVEIGSDGFIIKDWQDEV